VVKIYPIYESYFSHFKLTVNCCYSTLSTALDLYGFIRVVDKFEKKGKKRKTDTKKPIRNLFVEKLYPEFELPWLRDKLFAIGIESLLKLEPYEVL